MEKIKIDFTSSTNRRAIASCKIKQNSLVIERSPMISVLMYQYKSLYCSNCFKHERETKLMKCAACKVNSYCNSECQRMDWKIHKHECKILDSFVSKYKGICWLLNIGLRASILYDIDPIFRDHMDKMFIVYEFDPEKMKYIQETAYIIIQYRDISSTPDNFSHIISLLIKIELNSFTLPDEWTGNGQTFAITIYDTINYINHSCNSNCTSVFTRNQFKVFALRDIEEGEEIQISYVLDSMDYQERKEFLKRKFFFECKCELCEKEMNEKAIKIEDYEHLDFLKMKKNELEKYPSKVKYFLHKKCVLFTTKANKEKKFKSSLKGIKAQIRLFSRTNNPTKGWKYLELARIYLNLNNFVKSLKYQREGLKILTTFFEENEPQIIEHRKREMELIFFIDSKLNPSNKAGKFI